MFRKYVLMCMPAMSLGVLYLFIQTLGWAGKTKIKLAMNRGSKCLRIGTAALFSRVRAKERQWTQREEHFVLYISTTM
jgi:hypothetical protein